MLDICKTFFRNLNSRKVRYCHWKSNAHLDKALAGETDLDLLVHENDKKEFESILTKNDLKKMLSPPEKKFPGVEDYLGFDSATGGLIHLHVHYKLILGQKYIKNHHLPIENLIFQNLITRSEVYIPCPEVELILLVIRANLKVDYISLIKHGIKDLLRADYTAFPADIEKEFYYLIQNSNIDKVKDLLRQSEIPLPENLFIGFISKFIEKRLRCYHIITTEWKILSGLRGFKREKSIVIYIRYLYLTICNYPGINRMVKPEKKTLAKKGVIFSLVGADGSGKSTLRDDLEKWLSWKLTIQSYYYGIPKTKFINYLSYAIRGFSKFRMAFFAALTQYVLWTHVAKYRYQTYKSSQKNAGKGKVIITDRFPLEDFKRMAEPMDGPRLKADNSWVESFFSRIESGYYDKILLPGHLFVLQVAIEELRNRKSDLELSTHIAKAEAVNNVKGNDRIMIIDANRPYLEVRLKIKQKIWELL